MADNQIDQGNQVGHSDEIVALSGWWKFAVFLVLWFVPTLTITNTTSITLSGEHHIRELGYLWPWLILLHYQPSSYFETSMYNFVLPPYSLFIFLPTLILLGYLFTNRNADKLNTWTGQLIGLLVLQIFFIWFASQSQEYGNPNVTEERNYVFIPQIAISLVLLVRYALLKRRIRDHS